MCRHTCKHEWCVRCFALADVTNLEEQLIKQRHLTAECLHHIGVGQQATQHCLICCGFLCAVMLTENIFDCYCGALPLACKQREAWWFVHGYSNMLAESASA